MRLSKAHFVRKSRPMLPEESNSEIRPYAGNFLHDNKRRTFLTAGREFTENSYRNRT